MTEVSIGEWMAVITLGGTLIVGVAKFYAMFTKLDHTLGKLENTIVRVEKAKSSMAIVSQLLKNKSNLFSNKLERR
ncbi:hypothetical protein SNF32_00285 [Enterococcus mundtii]|nr:hypothetical protein [Enterococcus mundtii]